ncbi:MAG: cation transporter [Oscillospiraceae bacterium]|nr:cation transporter [Oscillospiraceae bacterium]
MVKNTAKIEGMACSMCEAHIKDTIRKAVPSADKVTASHTTGIATVLTEEPVNEAMLKAAVDETGYTLTSLESEPYTKKKFFWQK